MRPRTGVLVAMWALVLWGLFQAVGGVADHAYADDVICSGTNLGPDGEEHPSPMRRGDQCHPGPGSSGTRSYDEQRAAQREQRVDVVIGLCALGAGALGLGALSLQRRLSDRSPHHPWGVRGRRVRGRI